MSHPGFTLAAIRPLVQRSQLDGRSLRVRFVCPVTQIGVDAHWRAQPTGVGAAVADARDTARFAVRSQVDGFVRSVLGFGSLGRLGRQLSDAVLADGTTLTVDEEEAALIHAFRGASLSFAWVGARWVHHSVLEPDAEPRPTLVELPALAPREQQLAARMVVQVARSHGGISDDELLHLGSVLGGGPSVQSLIALPALTAEELAHTDHASRPALLTLCWSMALCDERFDHREEAVIEALAEGLGVPIEQRVEARRQAQLTVLDAWLEQAFCWGDEDPAALARYSQLAERIGVARGAADRALTRARRRWGMHA